MKMATKNLVKHQSYKTISVCKEMIEGNSFIILPKNDRHIFRIINL